MTLCRKTANCWRKARFCAAEVARSVSKPRTKGKTDFYMAIPAPWNSVLVLGSLFESHVGYGTIGAVHIRATGLREGHVSAGVDVGVSDPSH